MDKHIDELPQALQDRVRAKVGAPPETLGQAIGQLIDEALDSGWEYDREHDEFVQGTERVMVKQVWRAYTQERGA